MSGGSSGGNSSGPGLTVSPMGIALSPSTSTTFTCTVTGVSNTTCNWKVTESGGGSITPAGVYTAPAATGTYHVVATSAAMASLTATATVTVVNQTVGTCSSLPAAGTWQNITPPQLNGQNWCTPAGNATCPGAGQTGSSGQIATYGIHYFVLDPNNAGTIFLGTSALGIWKSTDCGSTWVHIDTGMNHTILDGGRNWSMVIDPTDSNVLYTVSGYSAQGGVYKTTNGGVDWTQTLPQNIVSITGNGFVEKITMDPTNNKHLLASFHTDCTGTPLPGATTDSSGGWGCLAETMDAGATWNLTLNAIPWLGSDGPGQTMIDSKTWYYATNGSDGLWRTTTAGVPTGGQPAWTQVYKGGTNGSVYLAKSGVYYAGGGSVNWSGDGTSWASIPNSPNSTSYNGSTTMVDDGTTLYVGSIQATYWTTADGKTPGTFTMMSSTPSKSVSRDSTAAPVTHLEIDSAHHLLYSSNLTNGFWRYVTQ